MKWLFKWTFRLIFLAVALVVALALSKDAILKALVEREIRAQTGMDVKIGKFSAGILSPVVDIEHLKLYNPPEFGGTPFLDIPELHVEYSRLGLAEKKLHLTLLRLNVAELNVVKNDAGRTNLATVRWKVPSRTTEARADAAFPVIDVLNLSVGKARFLDLKNPRHNREYRPNLQNQIFKNVKSPDDVNAILFLIWLRSGGDITGAKRPDQIFTLNCSPFLSDNAKPASSWGICSRSLRLTTSTGECM
jgi:uncharacterized protein involved in outer membrane biogenesis